MIISVIIPCYNVARHIEDVINNLPDQVDYIITVNDRSPDNTESIILQLQQKNKKIIYLKHEVNQGVGGAMLSGFKKSLELNCDITLKMDGDNQMDPSYIPVLIEPLINNKADFTKGNRFRDFTALKKMPIGRRIGNLGLSFLIKAASGYWNIFDPTNGYFAIKNETLQSMNFKKIHNRYFFESSMLIELYHVNGVIQDVPMKARYGDEISGLSKTKTLFEFPPKLFAAFLRRIALKYFLYEFNVASLFVLFGLPLFIFGSVYGIVNFIKYASEKIPAPTGTVVIPTLLITLGFQLLLAAANYDINNYPKRD
ncbi:glycosyltransferase family 2 protein [Niastella sp. OAS944]|uniref:glycosyltransferase family 2 protein n=1 Tax=Niastella sp. OAS944 TaxID=2664089 RepID=UPI0034740961|nr:glycosyltransferase involved in cell wall biosynthesis [Chitinophagaceae bacterium OAS944]